MHKLVVETKFTFGDSVRFDSPTQQRKGVGTIICITIDGDGDLDYMIKVGGGEGEDYLQPGILGNEITLLTMAEQNEQKVTAEEKKQNQTETTGGCMTVVAIVGVVLYYLIG